MSSDAKPMEIITGRDRRRAPHPVQWLADNGSAFTARETLDFAAALDLVPCFTPVRSPERQRCQRGFRHQGSSFTAIRNLPRVRVMKATPVM
jgi:transposase InsO family protein